MAARFSSAGRRWATSAAAASVLALAACGTASSTSGSAQDVVTHGTGGCRTTVAGVVAGSGAVSAGWLPGLFRLSGGASQGGLASVTYVLVTKRPDPPRLSITLTAMNGPLTRRFGPQSIVRRVVVQGKPGLLGTGPPAPQMAGVYWKPDRSYLINLVGYKLPARVLLFAAQSVRYAAPGVHELPMTAGSVISRAAAIAAALRMAGLAHAAAAAKLSSWTELAPILQTTRANSAAITASPALTTTPWLPVWLVLVRTGPGRGTAVVVDGRSGQPDLRLQTGTGRPWFAAITDRDPAVAIGCPGGSTARLPFGVLTRAEEAFLSPGDQLKLATVPAVNAADPSMFGGCVTLSCSVPALIWVQIKVTRAAPGKTLACPPPGISVPPGFHGKRVKEEYSVAVTDNFAAGCGPLPMAYQRLEDLAPPSGPAGH